MRTITAYLQTQRQRFLTELCEFVRLPSVSGQPEQARDVAHCASWLAAHLQKLGLEQIQIIPTPRHPLVYAAWHDAPTQPTVLIYGHYDVQPADPLYEWRTPPFTPTVRNGYLYGRGASDDKGQLFCHVKALEAYLKTTGRLPVNVICLFEGEEEIGSPNLKPWLLRHQAQLQADVAVISDTRFLARGRPALTYGLRGGLGLALTVGTSRVMFTPAATAGRSITRFKYSVRSLPLCMTAKDGLPFPVFTTTCVAGARPNGHLCGGRGRPMRQFCRAPERGWGGVKRPTRSMNAPPFAPR